MSDTELTMLEQGRRVALVVMRTDEAVLGSMIRYLWWRGWTSQQIAALSMKAALSGLLR
jgi:hypothetical protein